MKASTKIILCTLFSVLVANPVTAMGADSGSADQKVIKVCADHFPPWVIAKNVNGKLNYSGIDIDILSKIANALGVKTQYVDYPWARCISQLETGVISIIASFARTSDREKFVHYLEPYYAREQVAFFSKKGSTKQVKSYDDLYYLSIIGGLGYKYFPKFDQDSRLKVYRVSNDVTMIKMLLKGRGDILIGYDITTEYSLRDKGYMGQVEKQPYVASYQSASYVAVSRKSDLFSKMNLISETYRKMIDSGEIEKIKKKYMK